MKNTALALAVGATLAAPLAAAAQSQPDAASLSAGRFLIVDARSGRTVAALVPVDGKPHELRLIGVVSARAADSDQTAVPAARALTPAQFEESDKAGRRAQFYTAPDDGMFGW